MIGFGNGFIHHAVNESNLSLLIFLLKTPLDINLPNKEEKSALILAAEQNKIPIAALLLQYKAKVDIQDQELESALHKAMWNDNEEVAKLLLSYKANVNLLNEEEASPLTVAVYRKNREMVAFLFSYSCSHSLTIVNNFPDDEEKTPLHTAVKNRCFGIVLLLLKHNADLNLVDLLGNTPLHESILQEDEAIAKLLLDKKEVKPSKRNKKGNTPMHLAAWKGNLFLIKLLKSKGASLKKKNACKQTALQYAMQNHALTPHKKKSSNLCWLPVEVFFNPLSHKIVA